MNKKKVGTFALGATLGAVAGILLAPKSGKESRKALVKKANELIDKAKEIDVKEVKENIEKKANEIINELKDLDKEKVGVIAKKKAKDLLKSAEDLAQYAKDKATPVVSDAAEQLREKAVVVTKKVLKKLEND